MSVESDFSIVRHALFLRGAGCRLQPPQVGRVVLYASDLLTFIMLPNRSEWIWQNCFVY